MTKVWFYHLERRPLESVLPSLLEKCIAQGWNAVVEGRSEERLSALDTLLWTFSDESFLPHAVALEGDADLQPVYLTTGPENPNSAKVRFCIEGADPAPGLMETAAYERIFVLFDGEDAEALAVARAQWLALKTAPVERAYWRQDDGGRWQMKG